MSSEFYVWKDDQEVGPYGRGEVFKLLREGVLSENDWARTSSGVEWLPLSEVLKGSGATGLFTLDKIVVEQEQQRVPDETVPRLDPPRRQEKVEEPAAEKPRLERVQIEPRQILQAAAAIVLLMFAGAFFWNSARSSRVAGVPDKVTQSSTPTSVAPSAPHLPTPGTPVPAAPGVQIAEAQKSPAKPEPRKKPVRTKRAVVATTPSTPEPAEAAEPDTPMPMVADAAVANPPLAATPEPPVSINAIPLPATEGIRTSECWVAAMTPEPKAVFVLCFGPNSKPEHVVRDRRWQKFARENNFALAAISFSSPELTLKAGAGYPRADLGSGDMLIAGIIGGFGRPLPMVLYGRSGGAEFVASFANWKPESVLTWAAYGNDWGKIQPRRATAAPPGVLACDREDDERNNRSSAFFKKGRALDLRWAVASLSLPWKEREAHFDSFVCDYIKQVMAGGDEVWLGNEKANAMSKVERMVAPHQASWLPDPSLTPSWVKLSTGKEASTEATIVQRSFATKNPRQPQLNFFLRLPPGKDGKSVSGVLAFCTWENNDAEILTKLGIRTDGKQVNLPGPAALVRSIIVYAERHNMAVLTWGTVDAWNNKVSTDEMEREKQKDFDRNFDLLATAWERGIKELGRETGIPQNNFLLYGMSRGAQWAHRLALRKPDYFLAVHVHIPSTFDKPTPEANKPLWLITTGELEYGYERAQRFYSECQALGYPIIAKAIVGLGHEGSAIAEVLGLKFFDYSLSVRELRENYDRAQKDPLARFRETQSGPWLKTFREPEFFGDLVNQECFPIAQVDKIPPTFRVPLPTKAIAEAWNH